MGFRGCCGVVFLGFNVITFKCVDERVERHLVQKERLLFLSEKAELHVALDAARQDGLSQQLEKIILDVVLCENEKMRGEQT